jgi:tRNA acetyltransferase TAN1
MRQFAIRPTSRNSSQLSRDTVIKTVAQIVGPNHSVDLTNYDLLILVDVVLVRTQLPWPA